MCTLITVVNSAPKTRIRAVRVNALRGAGRGLALVEVLLLVLWVVRVAVVVMDHAVDS